MFDCSCNLNDRAKVRLGMQVRKARQAVNMTQHELALKAGINPGSVTSLERDDTARVGTLLAISKVLGSAFVLGEESSWMRENYKHLKNQDRTYLKGFPHGKANTYKRGCRCQPCTKANTRAKRLYRERLRAKT